jgi:hypothetical protein
MAIGYNTEIMKRLAAILVTGLLASGCAFLDQFSQMRTFSHCKFRLAGIENVRLAGVRIDGKSSLKQIDILDAVKIGAALKAGELPLALVLNVEVMNPNTETAAMNRLAWIMLVDEQEIVRGQLDRRVEIAPNGGMAPLPLDIALDLRQVLSGKSGDALLNLAFNVAGEGTHPTHVTLKVKPSILVGEQTLELPDYITISTEFGGDAGQP